jgi:hypothetical protein
VRRAKIKARHKAGLQVLRITPAARGGKKKRQRAQLASYTPNLLAKIRRAPVS